MSVAPFSPYIVGLVSIPIAATVVAVEIATRAQFQARARRLSRVHADCLALYVLYARFSIF